MARTVLLIILLDTLTDVPSILNKTLHEHFKQYANATIELNQQCDPALADFVLNKAKYDGENNKTNDTKPAAKIIELADSLYEDSVLDNYTPELEDVNSLENNLIDLTDGRRDNKEFSDYIMANPSGAFVGDVVEDAPFLVAIFETVANVTAQTCAGALLASRWVLTAASCVNVLGNLNGNKTNSSEGSTYTVVAGASNPFMDGTMHNVTKIILSDDKFTNDGLRMDFERELKRTFHLLPELGPTLAMMRIDPGVVAEAVEVWEGEAKGLNVTVYGWTLLRHDSYDAVRATSRSAVVSAPWMFHNVSTSALYLSMNTSLGYHSQMGSGGPVLVRGRPARLLGVLLEDHAPMIAEPLRRHAPWIQRVLNNDV